MENKMKEVAQLVGLELEEEFRMDNWSTKYKLTKNGFMYWSDHQQQWNYTCGIEDLFIGERQIIKIDKPILDEKEKEYLSAVIKPFRNRILYIAKSETVKTYDNPNPKIYECIYIMYKDSPKKKNPFYMGFPCFEKGTMYKGMELDKKYTLEELGL